MRYHAFTLLALFLTSPLYAEQFSFDIDAYEKKAFEWHGYTELRYEYIHLNNDSLLYDLNYPDGESTERRLNGAIELSGDYRSGSTRLSATWHGAARDDSTNSSSEGRLYEGYINRSETATLNWEAGKRALKWGKGYAWNPVGFIERPKDPTDPELGREGYILASADWVRSGEGALRTIGFTPVLLPVRQNINDDYAPITANNVAAKLYLLYHDIDIDFLALGNGSRPGRIGADISFNLSSQFEVHGEWAYIPDNPKHLLDNNGITIQEHDSHNYLLGLRYLTEDDITWIAEYLHQDQGYTEQEMKAYFSLLADSLQPDPIIKAGQQTGYLRPTPMRDYLYVRVSKKDPFDWLYATFALTTIQNFNDNSYLLMPEIGYTGITNLEFRLRLSMLNGSPYSEYGEKLNLNRIEARLRYFF